MIPTFRRSKHNMKIIFQLTGSFSSNSDRKLSTRTRKAKRSSTVSSYEQFEPRLLLTCDAGSAVDIIGTDGDDLIQVEVLSSTINVVINGSATEYSIENFDGELVIDGLGGEDVFEYRDNSGVRNDAVLCPNMATITGLLSVSGINVQHSFVWAGDGNGKAILHGSGDSENVLVNSQSIFMSGEGYSQRANGFDEYVIYGGEGYDYGYFTDSTMDDTFIGGPSDARLEFGGGSVVVFFEIESTIGSFSTGNDLAALNGSDSTDLFVSHSGEASLNVNQYQRYYSVTGIDTVISKGGLGEDVARISGGHGSTRMFSRPGYSALISQDFATFVSDYEETIASGGIGGYDYVIVRGTLGDDSFFAGPHVSLFRGPGFKTSMSSFDTLFVFGSEGNDTAIAPNFPGEHTFRGQARRSIIDSNFGVIVMLEFDRVFAVGGRAESEVDHVFFQGSDGNNQLFATLDSALLFGPGYQIHVERFWDRTFYALGQNDRAYFTIPGEMYFEGTPQISSITNSLNPASPISTVKGFNRVVVNFTSDGSDSKANAVLTGTEGNDEIYARRGFAKLTRELNNGREYSITAKNSSFVSFQGDGGHDVANLVGSELDEVAFLSVTDSQMVGGHADNRYRILLKDVTRVTMYSGNGGNDSLSISDTRSGNETFFGNSMYSYVRGDGFHLQGVGFDSVESRSIGGDDQAIFVDSGGDDLFTAQGLYATLVGVDKWTRAIGYERVFARSINGGSDTLTTSNVLFELIEIGNWNQ